MWLDGFFRKRTNTSSIPLYLFNTLERDKQIFTPSPHSAHVRMYNCGPTVYGRQHIGNLSMFVFTDILRRTLERNGMQVKQVINFTDFGHLVSDGDEGEDKMTKGMKAEKIPFTLENMKAFGEKYAQLFLEDIRALGIDTERITFPRASDYVPAMIAMIQTLEEKGYAYTIKDGMYFDTARFLGYGVLGGIDVHAQKEGVRVATNPDKHSAADFVLWKKSSKLGWDSPWGKGFPGWHLECSAMINALLGRQIDIHTGGIEHINIHHNNEIAQSEAATGKKPFSRFWLHREHIRMASAKIAKSTGNTAYLSDIIAKGLSPLALRYWFLTSHYRTPSNFTWEALEASQKALVRLNEKMESVRQEADSPAPAAFVASFDERMNHDLDTPGALALVWETLKDDGLSPSEVKAILGHVDAAFGLGLTKPDEKMASILSASVEVANEDLPEDVRALIDERESARSEKSWARADELRSEIEKLGFSVEDSSEGVKIRRQQS